MSLMPRPVAGWVALRPRILNTWSGSWRRAVLAGAVAGGCRPDTYNGRLATSAAGELAGSSGVRRSTATPA
jgi:hypothetical protein